MIRCGGWVDRGDGKGWVLDAPGQPAAAPAQPARTDTPTAQPDEQPEPAGEPYAARAECPDCGKDMAVNKDGTLRKHTCLIDAPLPEVTFDDGDGE